MWIFGICTSANRSISKNIPIADGNIFDEWGVGSKKIGEYTTVTSHPFREPDIAAIAKHRWPTIADPGRIEGLAEQARHWHEHTDYCITTTAPVSGVILEVYQYLRGTEELFTDLHLHPKFAEALIEKIAEVVAELYVYFVTPVAPLHYLGGICDRFRHPTWPAALARALSEVLQATDARGSSRP